MLLEISKYSDLYLMIIFDSEANKNQWKESGFPSQEAVKSSSTENSENTQSVSLESNIGWEEIVVF